MRLKLSLIVSIITFGLILFFQSLYSNPKKADPQNETFAIQNETIPLTKSTEGETSIKDNIPTIEKGYHADSTTINEIPILMYHYVRNYDNPEDPVGTNLSATIEKFTRDLDAIQELGYKTITFYDLYQGNQLPEKPIILTFDDGYSDFYQNALPLLLERNMTGVIYAITGRIDQSGYMTEAQIVDAKIKGIEIGSHTITHPNLSNTEPDRAINEIKASKSKLEAMISDEIVSFCYPSGYFSDQTIEIIKEAGYSYAVTTKIGRASLQKPFELKRYRINRDTRTSAYLQ